MYGGVGHGYTRGAARAAIACACVVSLAMIGYSPVAAGAADSGSSAPGVTAKTISIGLIESATGPASSTFGDSATGVEARFDQQNAEGGIDGRKLKLFVADDTSTPTGNLLAAEDLVSTKGVFGVISDNAVLVGGADYLQKQDVPVTEFSSITGEEPQYTDEFGITQGQLPSPATTQLGVLFKTLGVKNVSLLDYSDPQDSTASRSKRRGSRMLAD